MEINYFDTVRFKAKSCKAMSKGLDTYFRIDIARWKINVAREIVQEVCARSNHFIGRVSGLHISSKHYPGDAFYFSNNGSVWADYSLMKTRPETEIVELSYEMSIPVEHDPSLRIYPLFDFSEKMLSWDDECEQRKLVKGIVMRDQDFTTCRITDLVLLRDNKFIGEEYAVMVGLLTSLDFENTSKLVTKPHRQRK